jgi:lipoprotein-anchoring transpeptidase ErfK/SrfK
LPGDYVVDNKFSLPGDASRPLGMYRIKLTDQIGNRIDIHGTNDLPAVGTPGGPGSIALADQDIEDLHDILSIGSAVQILR